MGGGVVQVLSTSSPKSLQIHTTFYLGFSGYIKGNTPYTMDLNIFNGSVIITGIICLVKKSEEAD